MMSFLRKATASQSRMVGPFVSDSDFKTVQTGLTIANTDVKISAGGGAGSSKNSGGGTHRNNGVYSLTFDATDTATVGEFAVSVLVSGALVVTAKFWVLEAAVYDALFAASAPGYLQPATAGRTLVVDAAGLADANVVKLGPSGSGTAQTARDVGASVVTTSNVKTNQALATFTFLMTDSTNHAPATGLTITCTRSIDGGAFAAGTLANAAELASGVYKVDFGAGDLNGKVVILKVTATGADTAYERIITQP